MKTGNDFPGALQFRAWSWLQARGPGGAQAGLPAGKWGRRCPNLAYEQRAPVGERLRDGRRQGVEETEPVQVCRGARPPARTPWASQAPGPGTGCWDAGLLR